MRINQFVARSLGISRRKADDLILSGAIYVNSRVAQVHATVAECDVVLYRGERLLLPRAQTILLNKPVGYVCSTNGQGSPTIYDLLPEDFRQLKPIGRLDKQSSGALLMTNDGDLAYALTHPKFKKQKVYQVSLNRPLKHADLNIIKKGVKLDDGVSKMTIRENQDNKRTYTITMSEGKNRQIRRTLEALGYAVTKLHRTHFDNFHLANLASGKYRPVDTTPAQAS